ncbi:MAG: type II secretion system protein [Patescibacteria group bacterium]
MISKSGNLIRGMGRMSRRQGFTLIEVLIDAFVITAIFGVLVGSFLFVLKAVYTGQVRSQAVALANEQM